MTIIYTCQDVFSVFLSVFGGKKENLFNRKYGITVKYTDAMISVRYTSGRHRGSSI